MRRVFKMTRRYSNDERGGNATPNAEILPTKTPCHICKSRGAFLCEHDTVVRDSLKNTYAEDGRYYMAARNLSRSEQYSQAMRYDSAKKSANSQRTNLTRLMADNNKSYPKIFLSTPNKNYTNSRLNNNQRNSKNQQQTTTVKKSGGCCSIS